MIVLRTPKGWTGPEEVDGVPVEGTWRAHQVPLAEVRSNPEHLAQLEGWLRSYRPEELFDDDGPPRAEQLRALGAERGAPDGRQPARQRRQAATVDLDLPDFRDFGVDVPQPGGSVAEATRVLGDFLAEVDAARTRRTSACSGRTRPPPTAWQPSSRRPTRRGTRTSCRRRRAPRAGRPGHGGPVRAPVPGLAGGLPAHRAARAVLLLRGVHPHRRLDVQPARQVAQDDAAHRVAAPDRRP